MDPESATGSQGDAIEALYARGVADGLPVVPPRYARATVEKIAVNAVMAGCRPEYLPAVIAGIEAICDEDFDLLGVSGTTDAVAPLLIVNGPTRAALDINSGVGVFGPGWRDNATIGRALRLIWVNVGGARPGVILRACRRKGHAM